MPVIEGALRSEVIQSATAGSARHAPAPITVAPITTSAELAEIADDWNRLAGDNPFLRHEWLATWWRYFGTPKAQLMVAALREEDGRLAGAMPWCLDRSAWFGRVLRLLGSGIVCTDYVSLLANRQRAGEFAEQIADWLDDEFAGQWDALSFDQVDATVPGLAELITALRDRGHTIDERPGMHCWRVELPDCWEDYLGRFSRRRRERIRTASRQWFETGRAQLRSATDSAGLTTGWNIFVDLHQRRRQSLGERGCFADWRFANFLHDAVARLFAAGLVRLSWLQCDGLPAAVQLNLVSGDSLFTYQKGMDPDLAACEPGNLCMIAVLRRAIEDGFRGFDLLRGDEPYKARWQARPVPLVRWRVVNKKLTANCRHHVWQGSEIARNWGRLVRDRWSRRTHAETSLPAPSGRDADLPANPVPLANQR